MGLRTQADSASSTDPKDARVAILLAVYNGEAFLEPQVETLARQSASAIDLWISDDGSQDGSQAILNRVAASWAKGKVHLVAGPRRGFAENFRSLLTNRAIEADYFAFCDQDDIWDDDKLAAALEWLANQPKDKPALFCARTRTLTTNGTLTGFSPLFRREPSFRNAIVQSIAGGNTMVMNRAARAVVLEASCRSGFVSHDWWSYLIVAGVGGAVCYSPIARVGYRQHPGNLVGENNSWRARMFRLGHMLKGRFVRWNDRNMEGLALCEEMLTVDARETLRLFAQARSSPSVVTRLSSLIKSGVYRQTTLGQVGLFVACILKRL
jgi:glycosyltransferase involved in cell wall biosynthesis